MTRDPTSDRPPHRDDDGDESALLTKLTDVANILVVVFVLGVAGYLFIRAIL